MRRLVRACSLSSCLLALGLAPSIAQDVPRMLPIPEHNEVFPEVLNGKPARREDWPATLRFRSSVGYCTSTVVGERVLVTAAHCVNNGGEAEAILANKKIGLKCTHHPDYKGPACNAARLPEEAVGCTADVALCETDQPVPMTIGRFERLKPSPPSAVTGAKIPVLGYGCTVAGGPISEDLQIGEATVEWLATPGASANPRETYKELVKAKGGSAVCSGDSGGASYTSFDPGTRELSLITSRGNMSTDSYFVSLTDGHIVRFIKEWKSAPRNYLICGLDQQARNCVF